MDVFLFFFLFYYYYLGFQSQNLSIPNKNKLVGVRVGSLYMLSKIYEEYI